MKIQIALNKDIDKAREIINNFFSGKKVKLEEVDYQSRHIFHIIPPNNRIGKDFYDDITKLILDLILNIYSKDIIYKQIGTNFKNLNPNEKKQVGEISEKLLLNESNFIINDNHYVLITLSSDILNLGRDNQGRVHYSLNFAVQVKRNS